MRSIFKSLKKVITKGAAEEAIQQVEKSGDRYKVVTVSAKRAADIARENFNRKVVEATKRTLEQEVAEREAVSDSQENSTTKDDSPLSPRLR